MNALLVTRILAVFVAFLMLYLLLNYTFNTYVVNEAPVGQVHVDVWVPYLTAALALLTLGCTVRRNEARRVRWILLTCLILVFFGLSLRTIKFYARGGELYEMGPITNTQRGILAGMDDQRYCYHKSFPFIELKPAKYGPIITLFDGIWPSSFSDESVKKAFFGAVKPCSSGS